MRIVGLIGIGFFILTLWLINHKNNSMLEVLKQLKAVDFSQHAAMNQPLNTQQLKAFKDYNIKLGSEYTIISFWEHWCPACAKELPTFLYLSQKIPEAHLKIILINTDPAKYVKKGKNLIEKLNLNTLNHVFTNTPKFKKIFNVDVLPTTYLIYKNSMIYDMPGSYDWGHPETIKSFKSLTLKE